MKNLKDAFLFLFLDCCWAQRQRLLVVQNVRRIMLGHMDFLSYIPQIAFAETIMYPILSF